MYIVQCTLYILLVTKITAAQNEIALSYHRVRGLFFLADIFVTTTVLTTNDMTCNAYFCRRYKAKSLTLKLFTGITLIIAWHISSK